jgi:hypothetical protein
MKRWALRVLAAPLGVAVAAVFCAAVAATALADSPDAAVTDAGGAETLAPADGTKVTFESDRPLVSVYIAEGEVRDTSPRWPDPFKKLGRTPLTVGLRPGTYTVNVESPDIPVASTVLNVGDAPMTIRVRGGNDGLRTLSTFLLAASATAVLVGIVVETSYSQAPNGISKSAIAIPLFVGGGVGLGAGLTCWFFAKPAFEQTRARTPTLGLGLSRAF